MLGNDIQCLSFISLLASHPTLSLFLLHSLHLTFSSVFYFLLASDVLIFFLYLALRLSFSLLVSDLLVFPFSYWIRSSHLLPCLSSAYSSSLLPVSIYRCIGTLRISLLFFFFIVEAIYRRYVLSPPANESRFSLRWLTVFWLCGLNCGNTVTGSATPWLTGPSRGRWAQSTPILHSHAYVPSDACTLYICTRWHVNIQRSFNTYAKIWGICFAT